MTTAPHSPAAAPEPFIGPPTREDAEIDAYLEAQAEADRASYVAHYGQAAWDAYERHCQEEAEAYERCLVAQFADDPITRMASFDGYEMANLSRPIRERCAAQGCRFCQGELDDLDDAWGRRNR